MDWGGRLIELALGGVALSLDTDLAHVKKTALARLGEHNPLRHISANHDLLRALRLAWVRAGMDVLDEALRQARGPEWRPALPEIERFDGVARGELRAVRSAAFNRKAHPGATAIDAALDRVLAGVPEFVGAGAADGAAVDQAFAPTLAAVCGWPLQELPALVLQVARLGVELPGPGGAPGVPRAFGELVFAEFADLIKDPAKYPQAGAAFNVAMTQALNGLAQDALALVRGIDARLDELLPDADALQLLREGLARQDAGVAALHEDIAAMPAATVDAFMRRLQADGALPGIERQTLIALAQRLTRDEVRDVDRAVRELEHAVEVAARVMAGSDRAAPGDGFVAGVLSELAGHTRAGALDRGSEAVDEALAVLARQQAQRREGLLQSRRALIEAGVQQELLRRDAFAVARRIESLVALDQPQAAAASAAYAERARAYFDEGKVKGVNLSLEVVVEMAQRMRDAAPDAPARRAALELMADALTSLSDRVVDPSCLLQAVALRREILDSIERGAEGRAWGAAQGALGVALGKQGWRVYDRALLDEAIVALRAELEECPREREPVAWAAAQHGLGRALYALGQREGDAALLRQAIAAFDAALGERTRGRDAADWARSQLGRGVALSRLARVTGEVSASRLSVQAYRDALQERPRATAPIEWSTCMNHLALELMALGETTQDLALLDESVRTLGEVIASHDRGQHPVDWAIAQHNLGGALAVTAEVAGDPAPLERSVQALRAALQEFDRERTPVYWTASQTDLSSALAMLARHRASASLMREAVTAARAALELRDRAKAPLEWANSQLALAKALHGVAELGPDGEAARAAAEAYRHALSEFNAERRPTEYADAQAGLDALRALP